MAPEEFPDRPDALREIIGPYHHHIEQRPDRESMVLFDPRTGQYIVVQGTGANVPSLAYEAAGMQILAHYHPVDPLTGHVRPVDRFASENDFNSLVRRSDALGGQPVHDSLAIINRSTLSAILH